MASTVLNTLLGASWDLRLKYSDKYLNWGNKYSDKSSIGVISTVISTSVGVISTVISDKYFSWGNK